jgi:hypothetical protein
MSYSFSASSLNVDDFDKSFSAAVEDYRDHAHLAEDAKEQFATAVKAVKAIVKSGVVGSAVVTVSITGHANPDHKPTSGWSNDSLNIQVYSVESLNPSDK